MKLTIIAIIVFSAVYAVHATPVQHPSVWSDQKNVTKDDPLAAFPSWVKSSLAPTTCANPGHCGRAYQACCAGFAAKGYPCTCHLVDGTGKTGNCGTCGTAYAACCLAYGAKGSPCTCDIQ